MCLFFLDIVHMTCKSEKSAEEDLQQTIHTLFNYNDTGLFLEI